MSLISMIFGVAPAAAPIVGAWIVGRGGWHALFWALTVFAGALLALCAGVLPETHPRERRVALSPRSLFASYREILASDQFLPLALAITCNFGGLFVYIAGAPAFVLGILDLRQDQFYWLFVPAISGLVLGAMLAGRLAGRISARVLMGIGYSIIGSGGVIGLLVAWLVVPARVPWAFAAGVRGDRHQPDFADAESARTRSVSVTGRGSFRAGLHHARLQRVARRIAVAVARRQRTASGRRIRVPVCRRTVSPGAGTDDREALASNRSHRTRDTSPRRASATLRRDRAVKPLAAPPSRDFSSAKISSFVPMTMIWFSRGMSVPRLTEYPCRRQPVIVRDADRSPPCRRRRCDWRPGATIRNLQPALHRRSFQCATARRLVGLGTGASGRARGEGRGARGEGEGRGRGRGGRARKSTRWDLTFLFRPSPLSPSALLQAAHAPPATRASSASRSNQARAEPRRNV